MKKNKLLAMLLAATMVVGMGTTSFAASNYTATDITTETKDSVKSVLTISTTAGHTYKVYEMLTGDISGLTATTDGATGTLANVKLGINNNSTDADTFIAAIKSLSGANLSTTAGTYVTGNPVATVVGDGNALTVDVIDGYYVVEDTWTNGTVKQGETISRYMVAVAGDTTMAPKATTVPEIDKNIIDTDANKSLEQQAAEAAAKEAGEDVSKANAASKKTDTAAIGDVIEYEVTGTVPDMTGYTYYYYVVEDTLSKGLTLNDTDNKGFTVTVGDATLERGKDYYVYTTNNADGTTSFKLAFENMKGYTAGSAISVKYNATVDDDAVIGVDPNTNTVKLTYSNNPNTSDRHDSQPDNDHPNEPEQPGVPSPSHNVPTGTTPDRVTKTYVTKLTVVKVDEDMQILDGAEFTLTGDNLTKVELTTSTEFVAAATAGAGEYYKLADNKGYTLEAPTAASYTVNENGNGAYDLVEGNYVANTENKGEYDLAVAGNENLYESTTKDYNLVTTVSNTSEEAPSTGVVMELKNGAFTVSGLNAGEYTLTETKTPTGYNTIDPITFEIQASQTGSSATEGGAISWSSTSDKVVLDSTNGAFKAIIQNVKGTVLPSTGGIGTTIFYALGSMLVIFAGVVLVAKRRIAR